MIMGMRMGQTHEPKDCEKQIQCILAGCYHGWIQAHVLRRFYRFHGRPGENME